MALAQKFFQKAWPDIRWQAGPFAVQATMNTNESKVWLYLLPTARGERHAEYSRKIATKGLCIKLSSIRLEERTTPAGRFVASLERNLKAACLRG